MVLLWISTKFPSVSFCWNLYFSAFRLTFITMYLRRSFWRTNSQINELPPPSWRLVRYSFLRNWGIVSPIIWFIWCKSLFVANYSFLPAVLVFNPGRYRSYYFWLIFMSKFDYCKSIVIFHLNWPQMTLYRSNGSVNIGHLNDFAWINFYACLEDLKCIFQIVSGIF